METAQAPRPAQSDTGNLLASRPIEIAALGLAPEQLRFSRLGFSNRVIDTLQNVRALFTRSQNRYVAMFPYTPRKEDELELRKGEMFLVLERCQDGWFKGTSMHTGKIGVFPGNYMAPVTRNGSGTTQSKVPLAVVSQVGRGVTLVSPSTSATGSQQKPPGSSGPDCNKTLNSNTVPTAVVSAAHIQASNQQTKVLVHVTGQMTVNQARNAARTAAAHSQERPTAAVTPIQSQSPVAYITAVSVPSHIPVSAQQLPAQAVYTIPPTVTWPTIPLSCTTASLTPPNVNATSLDSEGLLRPVAVVAVPITPVSALPAGTAMVNRLEKDNKQEARPIMCERYRVVVSYPPQSEAELELKEGDIVFVHKKREDGWFKGTLQRNGKTGLFPGSFAESI
ncbi:UNVERIFIED_CONTAM: hypothetical protein FKN15_016792 [Acipenser sinensis]